MEKSALFEVASRKKYRFATVRGPVSVEDLWDMPLLSNDGFNLDAVAKKLDAQIESSGEKSFVKAKSEADADLNNMFEIVKYVIEILLAEKNEAENAAVKKAEKARLLGILARKKDEELEGLSVEDLEAKIAALS